MVANYFMYNICHLFLVCLARDNLAHSVYYHLLYSEKVVEKAWR